MPYIYFRKNPRMNPANSPVYYVTGPLHSGKTTGLRQWCAGRADVAGVFQPVIEGQRYFEEVRTGYRMQMETGPEEADAHTVGKYRFAVAAFDWAATVLVEALDVAEVKYLVVDEIGPLELRGQGLHTVLEELLLSPIPGVSLILVVRDYLLDAVLMHYGVKDVAIAFAG